MAARQARRVDLGLWFRVLFVVVAWVVVWWGGRSPQARPSKAGPSQPSSKASRGAGKPNCAALRGSEIHGAFRELTCLISWRRTLRARVRPVDRLIRRRFRELHQRLRRDTQDWRSVYRWQALYRLGTQMYPLQNRWAAHAKIPVYEVNGHHKALPFWIKESLRREVGPLFHLDSHADMRAIPSPKQVVAAIAQLRRGQNVKRAWHTLAHSIRDCAMPVAGAVLAGAYKRVIWGFPGWLREPSLLNRRFFFAAPRSPSVPVAPPPALFSHPAPLRRQRRRRRGAEFVPHPIFRQPGPASKSRARFAHGSRWKPSFRLYYDPHSEPHKKRPPRGTGIWQQLDHRARPHKKHFSTIRPLTLSILKAGLKIDARGRGQDAPGAKKLLAALPRGPFTLDLDLDFFASIDSDKLFMRAAGQEPAWSPRLFKRQRSLLERRLARFQKLLLFLKSKGRVPALITLADSTYMNFALDPVAEGQSEYTPLEHVAFLRRRVREILLAVYGQKVRGRTRSKAPKLSPSTATLKPLSRR